jgi:tetratricopeptide (TPR) repeat protein
MRKIALFFIARMLLLTMQAPALYSAQDKPSSAEELYNTGYLLTLLGAYEQALKLYDESLAIQPTPEAHTFKGWTYGQMRLYQQAIEEAQKRSASIRISAILITTSASTLLSCKETMKR